MSRSNISDLKTSAFCPHCNQYTLITIVENNVQWEIRQSYGVIPYCVYKVGNSENFWWIGKCHNCHRIVLVLNKGVMIYPNPKPKESDKNIPKNVRDDLDEAKICFSVNCYRASTAMSRRSLENCCIDKGADENKNLQGKIEDLFNLGIITKDIKNWADTVRWIGNDAVHINVNEIQREDSEDIIKLAEQIFHIVYIAPAIAKERLKKRKKSK